MATDYINPAEQTMVLVRSIAAHLAEEPNLPAPENLTRGEVDAWIRALETGINGRVIDMLALPVLECLLYKRGRNLAWKVKHLRRAPCEKFRPVVVNPWIPAEGVPSNHNQLPWILGDRQHQPIEINDDVEDSLDQHEQAAVADQDDDMEEEFTEIDGEGTQLNDSPHNIDKDNDSTLTTQQSIDEPDDTVLLNTVTAETVQDVRSLSTEDVAMQDVLEQNDSAAGSSTPNNTDNEKPTQPTSPDNEEDPNLASDDEGRTNWCVCNGEYTGSTMIECKNCEDPDCKGKWYHTTCVELARPPAENVDWYCGDCRKKLKLGVYSNGCVAQSRKPNQATGRTRRR